MLAPARSAAEAQITADQLLLAIMLGVATRREGRKRKHRSGSLLDECLSVLADPALNPKVHRLRSREGDASEAERLRLLGEAHAVMERLAPLARVLAEQIA